MKSSRKQAYNLEYGISFDIQQIDKLKELTRPAEILSRKINHLQGKNTHRIISIKLYFN